MSTDLDTRLRGAGAALRDGSAHLDPGGARPRSLRSLGLSLAVVVVVVLGAATALLVRGDDHTDDVSTETTDAPRLVPDRPEDIGLVPTGALDLPSDLIGDGGKVDVVVFGEADAADPFARADVAVFLEVPNQQDLQDGQDSALSPDGSVTVRGHDGEWSDNPTFGSWLEWPERTDLRIGLASRHLDHSQLLSVAEALEVDGLDVGLGSPPGIDAPLGLVGRIDDLSYGTALPLPSSAVGHVAGYQDGGSEEGANALVATFMGDAADRRVVQWLTRATDPAEVRGHDAWAGTYSLGELSSASASSGSATEPPSGSGSGGSTSTSPATESPVQVRTLIWDEVPGVVALVQANGLTSDQVTALVDSLRPATDREWSALVDLIAAHAGAEGDDGATETDGSDSATETDVATTVDRATADDGAVTESTMITAPPVAEAG
jgi:hypothetical protein